MGSLVWIFRRGDTSTRLDWTLLQFFNQLGKNKEQYEIFPFYGHGLDGLFSLR